MTRARNVADTQDNNGGPVSPVVAGKNAVINGGFDIWQRGTSVTSSSGVLGTTFLADRWSAYYYGGGNVANYTMSQQAQTPGAISGYEAPFFMRHAFPAGNSGTYWEFLTKIEDVRTFAGQTITISFWAKSSGTVNPSIELQQNFGSGGSTAVYAYPGTPSLSSSWTRYSFTTTLGSATGKTIGAGNYFQFKLYFGPSGGSVSAFNLDMAGVQIELGSVATPFSRAGGTLQGELLACQRYYQRLGALYGYAFASDSIQGTVSALPMRSMPTASMITSTPYAESPINVTARNGVNSTTAGSPNVNEYGNQVIRVNGYSGLSAGTISYIPSNQIALSAEL